jgi:rare lipoprotein A
MKNVWTLGIALILIAGMSGVGKARGSSGDPPSAGTSEETMLLESSGDRPTPRLATTAGIASYYAGHFHGRRTASGARYDQRDLTAAHPTLPFGTLLRVTNLANLRSVVVKVTDRGPFAPGRVIDVSRSAARRLGMLSDGLAQVRLRLIES